MSVLALILAGGKGSRLSVLTEQRAKPALPMGSKYRLIDFVLSNLANSKIEHVAVLAQFSPQELVQHIGDGAPWSDKAIPLWLPGVERTGMETYRGTADAVYQNRTFIAETGCELVLIAAGDHLYQQDYRDLIRFHQEKGAAFTLSAIEVQPAEAHKFGMLQVDADHKIVGFEEKPAQSESTLASTGNYVFNTDYLLELLEANAYDDHSANDFGRNIIPQVVAAGKAYAYPFHGVWADVGRVQEYWQANRSLLEEHPPFRVDDPHWPPLTRSEAGAPVHVGPDGRVTDSLVSDGCVIEGEVVGSVLSPGVQVGQGALVRRCVILRDALIHAGAVVVDCIIDEQAEVGVNAQIGVGNDETPNHKHPELFSSGLSLVGRQAHVPAGAVIGRNCLIASEAGPKDFGLLDLPSGSTVERKA